MLNLNDEFNAAFAWHQAGELERAKPVYRKILRSNPEHFDALQLLGTIALQQREFSDAVELLSAALKIENSNAAVLNNLGIAYRALNKAAEALVSYERAIAANPAYAEAHNNRGYILDSMKEYAEALACFDRAIELRPDYIEAICNRGKVLRSLKRFDEALICYDTTIRHRPDLFEAIYDRANLLLDLERHRDAITVYDQIILARPNFAEAHYTRGVALRALVKIDEALASVNKTISLRPDYAEAYNVRGLLMQDALHIDEALANFKHSCQINPAFTLAEFNEGLCRLLNGEFKIGWEKYELRWLAHLEINAPRDFDKPRWHRRDRLQGKVILIHSEQGLGDTVHFARYVSLLEAQGARVIFEVPGILKALFKSMDGDATIVERGEQLPEFDFHCPLMSLPFEFETELDTVPNATPYLRASQDRIDKWRGRIGDHGFKIGICWQGSHERTGRNIPLAELIPLMSIPNVRLISLQKNMDQKELQALAPNLPLEVLGSDFDCGSDAFQDTMAAMHCVDIVVSVDTAIAHLAGALGLPVRILLKFSADWRWLNGVDRSPWYPKARLYRQQQIGDWSAAVESLVESLLGKAEE